MQIFLGDRALSADEQDLQKSVLPEANVILVHDHLHPNSSAEDVMQLLDEMIALARTIE